MLSPGAGGSSAGQEQLAQRATRALPALACTQLQEQHGAAGGGAGEDGGGQPSLRGLHLSVALLACASFW